MSLIEEIEELKKLIKDNDRDAEDNGLVFFSILSRALENLNFSVELKDLIIELVSSLPVKLKNIKEKKRTVEQNNLNDDKEELSKLRMLIHRNINDFIYGTEYKRYQDQQRLSPNITKDKLRTSSSAPEVFDNGESATGSQHKNEESLSDIAIFELAKKFDRPNFSPNQRIQLLGKIVDFVSGSEAKINVSFQRAVQ
jgi:hypothetical protein